MVNTRNKVETPRSRAKRNLANAFLDCLEAQTEPNSQIRLTNARKRLEAARKQLIATMKSSLKHKSLKTTL